MNNTPEWNNEETALVWSWEDWGERIAKVIGCDPENPPDVVDAETARSLFGCEDPFPPRRQLDNLDKLLLLAIERVDWAQIAAHLSELARPKGATGPLHEWYIAGYEDESVAFASGKSPADVRLDEFKTILYANEQGINVFTAPATARLAEEVLDGGCFGWSYINGVACTYEEIQGASDE